MIHNIGFSDDGWDDLKIPITAARLGASAPPVFRKLQETAGGSTGVFAYHFSKSVEQQVYFELQMPHDWQNGTTIYPHIHWCGVDNEASVKVKWGLEYVITAYEGVIGNTVIVTGDTPENGDTGVTALKSQITNLGSGIDMLAFTGLSAILMGRLFRDVADDYDDEAVGISLDFHYKRWRLGSANPAS